MTFTVTVSTSQPDLRALRSPEESYSQSRFTITSAPTWRLISLHLANSPSRTSVGRLKRIGSIFHKIPGSQILSFDEFELDMSQFELRKSGERVLIEPQVFDLILFLA